MNKNINLLHKTTKCCFESILESGAVSEKNSPLPYGIILHCASDSSFFKASFSSIIFSIVIFIFYFY